MIGMRRILMVDDEPKLVNIVRDYLVSEGFEVLTAGSGEAGLEILEKEGLDLVVLDLMMPGMSGYEVFRVIRQKWDIPVIMLTARSEEVDKLLGLEMGADDYITKPFSLRELTARIRAVLRRGSRNETKEDSEDILQLGKVTVDLGRRQVLVSGETIAVTPTEFKILQVLMSRPGRVFSRLQLLDAALGAAYEGYERSIDTHISNLRKKIEIDPADPQYIQTVYGMGYKMEVPKA